jgi:mannose-6-phosphate isomerase-like protein (cupin superfamily)
MTYVVNVEDKFALIQEHWSPKILAQLNGQMVKAVRFQGDFIWHHHENEDELFYVVRGSMTMKFRDRECKLNEGEMIVVPRGVEHCPSAEEECWVLLFEPDTTLNTGNIINERTKKDLELI